MWTVRTRAGPSRPLKRFQVGPGRAPPGRLPSSAPLARACRGRAAADTGLSTQGPGLGGRGRGDEARAPARVGRGPSPSPGAYPAPAAPLPRRALRAESERAVKKAPARARRGGVGDCVAPGSGAGRGGVLAPRPARAQARAPGSGPPGLAWGPRANACFSLLPSSPCRLFVVLVRCLPSRPRPRPRENSKWP